MSSSRGRVARGTKIAYRRFAEPLQHVLNLRDATRRIDADAQSRVYDRAERSFNILQAVVSARTAFGTQADAAQRQGDVID